MQPTGDRRDSAQQAALRVARQYSRENAALAVFSWPYWRSRANVLGQRLPPGPLSPGAYKYPLEGFFKEKFKE